MTRRKLRTPAAAPAYNTLSTELGLSGLDPYASGVTATTSPKWMNASLCTSQFVAKNFFKKSVKKNAVYQVFHLELAGKVACICMGAPSEVGSLNLRR